MSVDLLAGLRCLAIEKCNSVDFVARVLSAYASDQVVLPVTGQTPAVLRRFVSGDAIPPNAGGGWFSEPAKPRADSAPAHISLTSGTTGEPKAILLSHRALGDVTERLSRIMEVDGSIREYIGVPVTFSFGLARVRTVAANGGAAFIPEHGFPVDEFAAMLARGEVNALSAVPTLLRLVLNERERFTVAANNLRWIEIGSQPMSADEKMQLRQLFPAARIVQHYGLTEASRSTFLVVSDATVKGLDSVGEPTGSVEVKIAGSGRIAIRGPHLADGILTMDGLSPITDCDGWLVTEDLGHFAGDSLHFDGRADDLINVGGIKVPADLFEATLRGRLGDGTRVGVAAGADALRGQLVIVAHEPADSAARLAEIDAAASETAKELGIGGAYVLHTMPSVPATDTGKVRRFQISRDFERDDGTESRSPAQTPNDSIGSSSVHQAFLDVFGAKAGDRSKSFYTLGGDSLNYVTMLTALERAIGDLPEDWDRLEIDRLTALEQPQVATGDCAIEAAFSAVFGEDSKEGASFHSLGGDSLSYVRKLTALEGLIPDLPEDWASLSIAMLRGLAQEQADQRAGQAPRQVIPTNLDTVRGLACILVVALHVVGAVPYHGLNLPMSSPWHTPMDTLDLVRMPLFTAMAGFLYAAMPAPRYGFWSFMRRKFRQLLIPLLFATFIYWALNNLGPHSAHESLLAVYLIPYKHLWYLDALLIIFAGVGLLDLLLGERPPIWGGILACAIVAQLCLSNVPLLLATGVPDLLSYFIVGMLLYRAPVLLRNAPLLTVSALVMTVIVGIELFAHPLFQSWQTEFDLICGGASIIVFLRLFPRWSLLERIAPYSFTIYLWHVFAIGTVRHILEKHGVHSISILFCIGMVTGITLPILLHLVMIRMPRFVSAAVIAR